VDSVISSVFHGCIAGTINLTSDMLEMRGTVLITVTDLWVVSLCQYVVLIYIPRPCFEISE
jgi:hypothetical protein